MREICTPGSEWGDGYKVPCRLGEATDSKGQRRQGSAKATVLRPVSTSHHVNHEWLLKFLGLRIGDKRVLRLIWRMLKGGVMEDGLTRASEEGTPQGGSLSPLLSNVYLHYGAPG